jgi:hypothetical protein
MSRREDYGSNDVDGADGFERCYGDRDDDGPSRADCEREDWDATHCHECGEELDNRGVCECCGWYADAPTCEMEGCDLDAEYGDKYCERHRTQMDKEAKDCAAEDAEDERRMERAFEKK